MDLEPALEPSDITVTYTTSEETNRLATSEDSPERQDSSHYTWVTVSMNNRLIVTTFRCTVHLNMKKRLRLCNKPSLLKVFVDFPSYRISLPLSFPLFLFSLSLPPPPILPPILPPSLPVHYLQSPPVVEMRSIPLHLHWMLAALRYPYRTTQKPAVKKRTAQAQIPMRRGVCGGGEACATSFSLMRMDVRANTM